MDFLEIRRKAKERAAAGEGAQGPTAQPAAAAEAPPSAASPTPPPTAPPPGPGPALPDRAAPKRAVAPPVPPPPAEEAGDEDDPVGEIDARFTTWRPGSGERPFVGAPERGEEALFADTAVPAVYAAPSEVVRPPLQPPEPPPAAVAPAAIPPEPLPAPEPRPAPARRASPPRFAAPPARDPLDEFFYRGDEELPTETSLPVDVEPEAHGPEDTRVEEYLTFLLGAEEFAVGIERVREVLKSPQITEVPRAPAGILGVVTVRGEVVAVFDPRRRLGLPGPTPEAGRGRIVIVDDGEGPCGLLVDTVASVVRLARGAIEPTPQGIGGAAADCLAGIGRERNRLFTLLDLGALLRRGPATPRGGRGVHAGS